METILEPHLEKQRHTINTTPLTPESVQFAQQRAAHGGAEVAPSEVQFSPIDSPEVIHQAEEIVSAEAERLASEAEGHADDGEVVANSAEIAERPYSPEADQHSIKNFGEVLAMYRSL